MQKNFVTLLLMLAWAGSGRSSDRDSAGHYLATHFGRHFIAAQILLAKEGENAAAYWQAQQLPAKTLLAVVAPELMRYHSLADAAEIISLEMLYVNFGRAYADFSVGYFQIKPSFAESLEKFALRHGLPAAVTAADTADTKINREKRLERLATVQGQAAYIALFYRVMIYRFPQWAALPPKQQTLSLATAYNAGWQLSEEQLQRFAYKKFFSIALWDSAAYNYAQVALRFFDWLQ